MSVITTTINITDRGPSLQGDHTIHVFVSSTPGQHRPSGREIGHISPTVGNKSLCCRNISLPRPETRGVCNSITLQPAVMHATSPAPPLSPLHTQDTQDAFNRRRLHTHCSLQTPALLPMTMRQDLKLTTILRTENFLCRYYVVIRKPGPLPLHSAALKQADQPCNMLGASRLELQTIHRFSQSQRRPLLGPSPG